MHPMDIERLRFAAINGHSLVWSENFWTAEYDTRFPGVRELTARALLALHQAVIERSQNPAKPFDLDPEHRQVLEKWQLALRAETQRRGRDVFEVLAEPLDLLLRY